jgi:hypothetical protein
MSLVFCKLIIVYKKWFIDLKVFETLRSGFLYFIASFKNVVFENKSSKVLKIDELIQMSPSHFKRLGE